jgi:hypothetical protein
LSRLFVSQCAGQESAYRIDDNHGRQFTAGEYIVSDGQFLICQVLTNPIVNPFIAATDQDKPGTACQFPGQPMIKQSTLRCEHQGISPGMSLFGMANGPCQGFGLHDHAATTAIGAIIHGAVGAFGKVSDIDCLDGYAIAFDGSLDNASHQQGGKHLRKQRKNRKIHPSIFQPFGKIYSQDFLFKVNIDHHRIDRWNEQFLSPVSHHVNVVASRGQNRLHSAQTSVIQRKGFKPHNLLPVVTAFFQLR